MNAFERNPNDPQRGPWVDPAKHSFHEPPRDLWEHGAQHEPYDPQQPWRSQNSSRFRWAYAMKPPQSEPGFNLKAWVLSVLVVIGLIFGTGHSDDAKTTPLWAAHTIGSGVPRVEKGSYVPPRLKERRVSVSARRRTASTPRCLYKLDPRAQPSFFIAYAETTYENADEFYERRETVIDGIQIAVTKFALAQKGKKRDFSHMSAMAEKEFGTAYLQLYSSVNMEAYASQIRRPKGEVIPNTAPDLKRENEPDKIVRESLNSARVQKKFMEIAEANGPLLNKAERDDAVKQGIQHYEIFYASDEANA